MVSLCKCQSLINITTYGDTKDVFLCSRCSKIIKIEKERDYED